SGANRKTFACLRFTGFDPFRKSGTRAAMAQRKSYGVCRPQQRMERMAIERVPAAWKCSLENRPYGGEAQVVSSAGRPLSKFMRNPRAQPQKTMWSFGSSKDTEDPGRTRADHDQTIRRGFQGSV